MQDKAEQAEKLASCSATATNSQSESTTCASTNLGNIASSQAAPAAAAEPPPTDQIIDVADVRQYLKSWGCLAHAGVRALLDQAEAAHAAPAAVAVPDGRDSVLRDLTEHASQVDNHTPQSFASGVKKLAARARAALAATPSMAINPEECAQEVFKNGASVGLFDIPKETANAICAGVSLATGARVDWHYIAGRVHIKALAATPAAPAGVAEPAPITFMTEDRAREWAWDKVREEVGTQGWTAGESFNFHGFYLWGWNYRAQYELQRTATRSAVMQEILSAAPAAATPVVLPEPAVIATSKRESPAKGSVEFTWGVEALKEEGEHKLFTEQQLRALLATGGPAQAVKPRLDLTVNQLRQAIEFATGGFTPDTEDELETSLTFCIGPLKDDDVEGMHCWLTDLAEEGAIPLDEYPTESDLKKAQAPQAQADARDALPAIKDMQNSPPHLNLNDRAFWVLGWNECRDSVRDAQHRAAIAAGKGA